MFLPELLYSDLISSEAALVNFFYIAHVIDQCP